MALQAICDRLGPDQIDALLRKWLAILPHPFSPADRAAGYRYDISILQAEFSVTQMLDEPVAGRVFFEQVIRDNLDIGRPDQVVLIFDRRLMRRGKRPTPGRFRTRVITEGVTPSLHVDYKHTRIKQYHKEGRALRTETTVNDTTDFGIGKRLTNLPALREIGTHANRRLLRVQSLSHDPITGVDALDTITAALTTGTGTRVPGLRLAEQRSHALLQALLTFGCQTNGFTNRDLHALTTELRGLNPARSPPGKPPMTCADSKPAASSPASRTVTATPSPTTAYTPPASSPACTTDSCPTDWPSSPTPPPRHYALPLSPTTTLSKTSAAQ